MQVQVGEAVGQRCRCQCEQPKQCNDASRQGRRNKRAAAIAFPGAIMGIGPLSNGPGATFASAPLDAAASGLVLVLERFGAANRHYTCCV